MQIIYYFYTHSLHHSMLLFAVSTSLPVRQAYYGSPDNHSILLDDLVCSGNENSLLECPRVPSADVGVSDCSHSEDAGVRCEGVYVRALVLFTGRLYTVSYLLCLHTCMTINNNVKELT